MVYNKISKTAISLGLFVKNQGFRVSKSIKKQQKNDQKSIEKCIIFEYRFLSIFDRFWESKLGPKSNKDRLKIDHKK